MCVYARAWRDSGTKIGSAKANEEVEHNETEEDKYNGEEEIRTYIPKNKKKT